MFIFFRYLIALSFPIFFNTRAFLQNENLFFDANFISNIKNLDTYLFEVKLNLVLTEAFNILMLKNYLIDIDASILTLRGLSNKIRYSICTKEVYATP